MEDEKKMKKENKRERKKERRKERMFVIVLSMYFWAWAPTYESKCMEVGRDYGRQRIGNNWISCPCLLHILQN